jgi:hypothetical protein
MYNSIYPCEKDLGIFFALMASPCSFVTMMREFDREQDEHCSQLNRKVSILWMGLAIITDGDMGDLFHLLGLTEDDHRVTFSYKRNAASRPPSPAESDHLSTGWMITRWMYRADCGRFAAIASKPRYITSAGEARSRFSSLLHPRGRFTRASPALITNCGFESDYLHDCNDRENTAARPHGRTAT